MVPAGGGVPAAIMLQQHQRPSGWGSNSSNYNHNHSWQQSRQQWCCCRCTTRGLVLACITTAGLAWAAILVYMFASQGNSAPALQNVNLFHEQHSGHANPAASSSAASPSSSQIEGAQPLAANLAPVPLVSPAPPPLPESSVLHSTSGMSVADAMLLAELEAIAPMGVTRQAFSAVFSPVTQPQGDALPVLTATLVPPRRGYPLVASNLRPREFGEVVGAAVVTLRQAMGTRERPQQETAIMQAANATGGPDGPPTLAFMLVCHNELEPRVARWSQAATNMPCAADNLGAVVTEAGTSRRVATAPRVWFRRSGQLASAMTPILRNIVFMFVPLLQHTADSIADLSLVVQLLPSNGRHQQAGTQVADPIEVKVQPGPAVAPAQAANAASERIPDSGRGARGVTACVVRASGSDLNDNSVLEKWMISAAIAGVSRIHVYDVHDVGVAPPGSTGWATKSVFGLAQHTQWTQDMDIVPRTLPHNKVVPQPRPHHPQHTHTHIAKRSKLTCPSVRLVSTTHPPVHAIPGRPHTASLQSLLAALQTLCRVALASDRGAAHRFPAIPTANRLAASVAEAPQHAEHGLHPHSNQAAN